MIAPIDDLVQGRLRGDPLRAESFVVEYDMPDGVRSIAAQLQAFGTERGLIVYMADDDRGREARTGTPFEGTTRFALMMPPLGKPSVIDRAYGESLDEREIGREAFVYEALRLLDVQTLRVRLADVVITNTNRASHGRTQRRVALLVEHIDDALARVGGRRSNALSASVAGKALAKFVLSEDMIGNLDWSLFGSSQNLVLVEGSDSTWVLPIDFDKSAWVTDNGLTPEVRDHGYSMPSDTWENCLAHRKEAAAEMVARKGALLDRLRQFPFASDEAGRDTIAGHVDYFFARLQRIP